MVRGEVPKQAVRILVVITVHPIRPLLSDDRAQEQLVEITAPGGEHLGPPVGGRVPGHRQTRREVVVGDGEGLGRLRGHPVLHQRVDAPRCVRHDAQGAQLRGLEADDGVVPRQPSEGGDLQRVDDVGDVLDDGAASLEDRVVPDARGVSRIPEAAELEQPVEVLRLEGGVEERVSGGLGALALEPQTETEAQIGDRMVAVLQVEPRREPDRLVLYLRRGRQERAHGIRRVWLRGEQGVQHIGPLARRGIAAAEVGRDDVARLRLTPEALALQVEPHFEVMAAPQVGDEDAQVLAEGEPLSFVGQVLVIRSADDSRVPIDVVVPVGGQGRQPAVGIETRRLRRVVEYLVVVAVLPRIQLAVAVLILPQRSFAQGRELTVAVQILPGVEHVVVVRVLEDSELAVELVVLPRIPLGGLHEAVVVAVHPEDAVAVGVGVEIRADGGALIERRDGGLERRQGAEDAGRFERHHRPPKPVREAALLAREGVQPLVQVLLRVVVDRQRQTLRRAHLPGQFQELAKLPGTPQEGGVQSVDRVLPADVFVGEVEPRPVPRDRASQRQERQVVVEAQRPQPQLADTRVQARVVDARSIAVQGRAAPEELERTLEFVATRLGDDVREAALRATVFRRRARGLDLDLLDRLDVELRPDLSGQGIGRGHPVHERHDVGVPGAVDVRVAVAIDVRHARGQRERVLIIAAEERQRVDELGAQASLGGGLLQIDDVRAGPHLDVLAQGGLA